MVKNVSAIVSGAGWIAGFMDRLIEALQARGCSNEEIHTLVMSKAKLAVDPIADAVVAVIRQATKNIIDCDADAVVPNGWTVESHKKGGQFAFDPAKIKLYLSTNQQSGKYIEGNKLRKELANESVLNANVLDYLLKNPRLIPEEWKKDASGNTRCIFFWGTIYRYSSGILYVRYLYWDDGSWYWSHNWLDSVWHNFSPAAVLAS
jgi:hypothetical protein